MLDPALSRLSKHPWAGVTEVGDQSAYVADMARALRIVMPRVRTRLGDAPFRNFADKFARAFMARYQSAIFRCKRIGDMGAQQMLLDAQAIRALLLAAPGMRGPSETAGASSGSSGGGAGGEDEDLDGLAAVTASEPALPPPPVYAKYVQREMPRVEMLLKIIGSPKERFGDTIKALWPEAQLADLQRVMDLKGLARKEQQDILVSLGLAKPSAPVLPTALTAGLGLGGSLTSSSSSSGAAAGGGGGASGGASASSSSAGGAGISGVTVGSFGAASGGGAAGGGGTGASGVGGMSNVMKDVMGSMGGTKLSMKDMGMGKLFGGGKGKKGMGTGSGGTN